MIAIKLIIGLFISMAVSLCPTLAVAANLAVHDVDDKVFIAEISADNAYATIWQQDDWDIVRFSSLVVPIWVSADYVRVDDATAVVTGDRLRARVRPSLNAPVVALILRGHKSSVLEQRDGFVQIYAPRSVAFAVPRRVPAAGTFKPLLPSNVATQVVRQDPAELTAANHNENQPAPIAAPSVSPTATPVQSDLPPVESATVQQRSRESASPVVDNIPTVQNQARTIAQQHQLAPGDTISLQVFGEPDLSISKVRIPQSGRVSFPLIGSTEVAGKGIKQVEREVRESLSRGYIRNPRLSVTIDSYRPIFIKGAIASTGSFPYTEGLTISKVIALAGGTKNSARKNGVSISRDGAILERELSVDSDYEVLSGDIISVAEELGVGDESTLYVYLHGEVNRPGEYNFRRGLTVEKAVVLAGGFTLRASRRKIAVSRMIEGEETPVKFKKVALHFPVEPGDIIDIGASWF